MIIMLRSSTRCLLALGIMIHDQVLRGCKRTNLYLAGYVWMRSESLVLVPCSMLIAAVSPENLRGQSPDTGINCTNLTSR